MTLSMFTVAFYKIHYNIFVTSNELGHHSLNNTIYKIINNNIFKQNK